MRKSVLITTTHHAPYMDKWFEAIEKEYDLEVLYNHAHNSAKSWKDFQVIKGSF